MADTYEKDLGQKSSLTTSDFIRVVGSDNVSYKQSMSDVIAVTKSNIIKTKAISGTFDSNGEISVGIGGDHTPIGLISVSRTGWRYMFSYTGSGAWSIAFVSRTGTPATGTLTATLLYI